tara:strand:- start:5419 stop:5736 length:318 start_codon:yes stop_codon:yes gene_type:complete
MTKTHQYCVAENWGEGFIEANESISFSISGLPGNVWRLPAHNKNANVWIHKVLGVPKTKDEAQVIVDGVMTQAQTDWDSNNVEGESAQDKNRRLGDRPVLLILEE